MTYKLLNLACGSKISNVGDWTNIDFYSPYRDVLRMNILEGLKFPDMTFDVVYSSQFIEHLTIDQAHDVLREIIRVIKPNGILRIVTPDMEELARSYLELLKALRNGDSQELRNRMDWIRLEIFDQVGRDKPGGGMLEYLEKNYDEKTKAYIFERLGYTANDYYSPRSSRGMALNAEFFLKLNRIPRKLFYLIKNFMATESMRIGYYRSSGDVHRYLHDYFTLTRLLENVGFHSVKVEGPKTSSISDWSMYQLDEINGQINCPKSLYIEAKR